MTTANIKRADNRQPALESVDRAPQLVAASESGFVLREDTHGDGVKTGTPPDATDPAPKGIGPASDGSSVPTDTGEQVQNDERVTDPAVGYTPQERAAIDEANAAFAPVIDAADTLDKTIENIETWAPPLVRGVRALRRRARRETGALNYFDQQYRTRFGDLLSAEPIGPWLLAHHAELNAVHYLGDDDHLDKFMEWRRTEVTEEKRHKWRSLRTLVRHFKRWQSGTGASKDRRTCDQKAIERVRTEGHKADAARLAEVEQVRQELATGTIKTTETLWTALRRAGPDMVVQALRDQDARDYARTVYELIGRWLNEPSA
jgi:hypothetical protein